ncbi:cytochrome P450 [Chamaesiphon sp. VAR_48_metabat_403]|uniref:cytochrome P450 n=1 Tax=Chamaesiphon sp. VAR_48_metabat_403 TaxID=2964700 RepID=UPI00286E4DB6|nr:cytochrome P450 [Chamaesiphon sp. VAR_48_metabat_403]
MCVCPGPEANRLVLKEQADRLSSRLGNQYLAPIVSTDAVLLQDGEQHRTSRKMILPVFHQQAIASYFDTVQSVVTAAVADWGERGTIYLDAELRKLTLAVVVKTFLGSEKTAEIRQVSEWFTTLTGGLYGLFKWDRPLTIHGRGQAARRKIVKYIRQVIRERIDRSDDPANALDVLELLMNTVDEDGNKFTETQIVNQAILFLFAGHETTSSLMDWVLFELGNSPEWRQKLRDEHQQVVGNEPIAMSQIRQLPQMSNVLKEGERLYPPLLQKYDWTVTPTTA